MESFNDGILVCQPHARVGRAGMIKRRTVLGLTAALATPRILRAQTVASTLRFVPQADLRILDPVWSTGYITRNYAYLVYGHAACPRRNRRDPAADGRGLGLRSRTGWALPSAFARALPSTTAGRCGPRTASPPSGAGPRATRPGDASWRRPTPSRWSTTARSGFASSSRFPAALSVLSRYSSTPFIMPERNALTDPNSQVTDAIGSGPFSFVP